MFSVVFFVKNMCRGKARKGSEPPGKDDCHSSREAVVLDFVAILRLRGKKYEKRMPVRKMT
jgi:hypothetical protein